MPQMAPISWLTLFLVFSATLIMFNTMNYYLFMPNLPKSTQSSKKLSTKQMNWKW